MIAGIRGRRCTHLPKTRNKGFFSRHVRIVTWQHRRHHVRDAMLHLPAVQGHHAGVGIRFPRSLRASNPIRRHLHVVRPWRRRHPFARRPTAPDIDPRISPFYRVLDHGFPVRFHHPGCKRDPFESSPSWPRSPSRRLPSPGPCIDRATEIGTFFFNDLGAWMLGVAVACSVSGLLVIAGVTINRAWPSR